MVPILLRQRQILPHICEDGTLGLGVLPALICLLEVAFGDPDRIGIAERLIEVINSITVILSVDTVFEGIVADHNWKQSGI